MALDSGLSALIFDPTSPEPCAETGNSEYSTIASFTARATSSSIGRALLRCLDVVETRARQRVARREQRAAVLVGNDRDRDTSRALIASAVISSLSMPISGRKTGSVTTLPTTARFSSVCDATWPTTSPVTSACARRSPRDALGDAQHQPAVDHHAHRAGTDSTTCCWISPNGDEIELRAVLPLRQELHQLARLFLRRARQDRIAVEVHEGHRAAALHHAMRGDRRIDAARQQAHHATGRAGRQPAGAAFLAEEVERLVRSAARRESSSAGSSRLTRQPRASLMRPPTSRSICGDVIGKRLSARRADTRKLSHVRSPRSSRIAVAMHVEIERQCGRRSEKFAMPNVRRMRSPTSSARRAGSEHDLDPAHQRAHVVHVEIGDRFSEIAHEAREEPRRFFPLSASSW